MVKTLATSIVLFISLFCATAFGQSHVPTLGSVNNWTNYNSFVAGHLSYGTIDQACPNNYYQAGYHASDFSPICLTFSALTGVTSLNTLSGNITLANPDGNLSILLQGSSTIDINCPGCGGSGGGSPGGGTGALQWKNSGGGFSGTVITGMVASGGAAGPRQAIAGTDFALPFSINCTGGIACPQVGSTYNFTATGSAGSGNVSQANFGQVGGYAADGGSTTIGGAPNLYSINPNWSLNQMNALMSRFNGTTITSWSVTSGTATFQSLNSWSAGDVITISGLTTGSCFNNSFFTVLSTGLSNAQFEVSAGSCTGSATETGESLISPISGGSHGLVIVPTGMTDGPANAWSNTLAQTLDWRLGYAWEQASQFGIKCDATSFNVVLTAGSNQVNVGSSLNQSTAQGQTMVIGQQVGYGQYGTQRDWEPTITSYSPPYITLSGNAPFNYSGVAYFGTNNQVALTQEQKTLGGAYPLYIPTGCRMLTGPVRWVGSVIGQQMNYSGFVGIPGQDILQSQDGTPITAWSINTSTGKTTFTIPAYAAHNIIADNGTGLLGDSIQLKNFPVSTFFNNQTVQIASQPTPTTFTVNNVFGQSTSSSTEAGLAGPTNLPNTNGLRMENHSYFVNNAIDPSFQWTHYDPNGSTSTVEPPMYRPLDVVGEPANNPLGPAWGLSGVNGVAKTTQNSNIICVSTAAIPTTSYVGPGQFPRIPAVGTTIVFPYQGTWFSTTVTSNTGTCPGGYTGSTLNAALPNVSSFTGTQTEWFTYTTPQTIAVAIPSTITYPYTVTLALPANLQAVYESNISSHGRVNIKGDQFDYTGATYSAVASTATLNLVDGPTSINGGAGDAVGSIVFPMNPCQAMYNQPYPVTPSQSTTSATPAYAVYYAGLCGGNAALSLPNADAIAYTSVSSGLSVAYLNNLAVNPTQANSVGVGNQDNNGGMFMYMGGNNGGYGNTISNIRDNYTWGGFMQGPASVNEHGVRAVGPTNTGQSLNNCTFRTGYPISLVAFEQGNIDRCDTYPSETSPIDGSLVGASTALYMAYTLSELDGQGVTNTSQVTVKDFNGEPENGNHEEFPPSVYSDCANCNFIQTIFEGGFNIFGGSYQILHGTSISGPVFNYGSNNYFEHLSGLSVNYIDSNVYNGSLGFYNWGQNSTCQVQVGSTGAMRNCGVGFVQDYNGHDVWASMMGNNVNPTENILGGMIVPGEFAGAGLFTTFDSTELWWGQHAECGIGTGQECILSQFDGFGGYIFIGPHERIADAQSVVKANFRLKNSGTASFRLQVLALTGGTPPVVGSNTFTVTSSSWTPVQLPVDFTGYAGDSMELVLDSGSASNVLEIGYFNFVPFPGQLYVPLGTPTEGGTCPVSGEIKIDSTHYWVCAPSSGATFGPGTWKNVAIT